VVMKRDEGEEIRPSRGELEVSFSDLGDVTLTRSRAIKLAGAALAGGALTVLWPAEADARNNKKKKKKRRRRRRQVKSNPQTLDFGDTSVTVPSLPQGVTISNVGPDTVVLRPVVVGEGFTLVDGAKFTLAPGETKLVEVVFDPSVTGPSTGDLSIVDTRDGLVVENIDLLGNGVTV
jgi:hypothetical protein